MIDILLHGTRDVLTVLAVVVIYSLFIWILASCVGFSDRDDSWT